MKTNIEFWNKKLDELRSHANLISEVKLGLEIGISPAMLAHVRSGRRNLPLPARIRLLDKLGYSLTRDLLIRMLPEDDVRELVAFESRLLKPDNYTDPSNEKLDLPPLESGKHDFWNLKLDALKASSGLLKEIELADRIKVNPALLTHVRAGRRKLPIAAKLKLLDRLGYNLTRNLVLRALPEESMKTLIAIDNARLGHASEKASQEAKYNCSKELPPIPTLNA